VQPGVAGWAGQQQDGQKDKGVTQAVVRPRSRRKQIPQAAGNSSLGELTREDGAGHHRISGGQDGPNEQRHQDRRTQNQPHERAAAEPHHGQQRPKEHGERPPMSQWIALGQAQGSPHQPDGQGQARRLLEDLLLRRPGEHVQQVEPRGPQSHSGEEGHHRLGDPQARLDDVGNQSHKQDQGADGGQSDVQLVHAPLLGASAHISAPDTSATSATAQRCRPALRPGDER